MTIPDRGEVLKPAHPENQEAPKARRFSRRQLLFGATTAGGVAVIAAGVATGVIKLPSAEPSWAEAAEDTPPKLPPPDPEKLRQMLIPKPNPRRAQEGVLAPPGLTKRILLPVGPQRNSVESLPILDMAEWYKTAVEVASLNGKVSSLIEPGAEYQVNFVADPAIQNQAEQFATEDQARYGYDQLITAGFATRDKIPVGITLEETGVRGSDGNPVSLGFFGRTDFIYQGKRIRAGLYAPPLPPAGTSIRGMRTTDTIRASGFVGLDLAYASIVGGLIFDSMDELSQDQRDRRRQIGQTFILLPRLAPR